MSLSLRCLKLPVGRRRCILSPITTDAVADCSGPRLLQCQLPLRSKRTVSTSTFLRAQAATVTPSKASSRPEPTVSGDAGKQPIHPPAAPVKLQEDDPTHVDWTKSFHGLSVEPFPKEAANVLQAPLEAEDVEIKPDGIIYLPEIKYRRILNKAFGPGAWGLAPRSEEIVTDKSVTREYALLVHGR